MGQTQTLIKVNSNAKLNHLGSNFTSKPNTVSTNRVEKPILVLDSNSREKM